MPTRLRVLWCAMGAAALVVLGLAVPPAASVSRAAPGPHSSISRGSTGDHQAVATASVRLERAGNESQSHRVDVTGVGATSAARAAGPQLELSDGSRTGPTPSDPGAVRTRAPPVVV